MHRHAERHPLLTSLVVALALLPVAGCDPLECGANTLEQNGKCVAQTVPQPELECGPGTVYNATSGRCENALFADGGGLCGANTVVIISDAGIRTCVGTGGGTTDCSQALPCPSSTASDKVTLCGRIYDLEDSTPLDDGLAADGEPYKTLEVRAFDPTAFIANPGAAPVLVRVAPDACGRFVLADVTRPGSGLIAVATEDVTLADGKTPAIGDNVVPTGIALSAIGVSVADGLRAWTLRRTTDQAWSTAAGLASGSTFGSLGVYIPIFEGPGAAVPPLPGAPFAGVTIAAVDQTGARQTHPDLDFYFDDTTKSSRRSVSTSLSTTGPNGTGLYVGGGFGLYSGVGGLPQGVCWRKDSAASPVGAAFVQERAPDTGACP